MKYFLDLNSEKHSEYKLLDLLKQSYDTTNNKKNKSLINDIIRDGRLIIQGINKWNTKAILDIILVGDYDIKKDENILFLLNMIDYLCDNNKTQLKYYLLELIGCVNIYLHSLRKNIKEKSPVYKMEVQFFYLTLFLFLFLYQNRI